MLQNVGIANRQLTPDWPVCDILRGVSPAIDADMLCHKMWKPRCNPLIRKACPCMGGI